MKCERINKKGGISEVLVGNSSAADLCVVASGEFSSFQVWKNPLCKWGTCMCQTFRFYLLNQKAVLNE